MDDEASMHDVLERLLQDESAEPRELPLSLLTAITNNYSGVGQIGEDGGYKVYKAVLQNGTVTVKRLRRPGPVDEKRFENEVGCLLRVKHKNIVRLLGYCSDTRKEMMEYHYQLLMVDVPQTLLCFEYLRGGKLDVYITDASRGFGWRKRYKIIKGICEGLHYLHENNIVHLDLSPANIYLDENKVPKICNFGSSRRLEESQSNVFTEDISGSLGYMAPEFVENGTITLKPDIYSLGVLIIEILMGQKEPFVVEDILKSWSDRLGMSLEDTRLQQVRVCAEIGIHCLDEDPLKRPTMAHIIDMLAETESTNEFTEPDETESMDEFTPDDEQVDGLESVQIMELNILERIVAGYEEPSDLELSLLQSITENFSEQRKIGEGGCGEVYKGILGNRVVAVKRLSNTRTIKDRIFHREVKSLITVNHRNIVQFLGYCSFTKERALTFEGTIIMADIRERLLCFEYISNGSLENHLSDELRGLQWHTRYEIIVGICMGLLYLHKEKHIVHMDLKPGNILLDDCMVPKITDFGLSRLDNNSQAMTTSRLMSPGYCAPEYFLEGKSSSMSDIYSLGVIITELVTGSKTEPDLTKVLRRWRHRWIKSSKHGPLGYQQVTKCLELAQRCKQIDPTSRPDIVDITNELNSIDSKGNQFQVIPCLEDMLGIEPLEIHFPYELDQQISHSIVLTNDTDDQIAFMTRSSSRSFHTVPDKGIVPPRSKCSFTVKMQAQVNALPNRSNHKEGITVLSARVDGRLSAADITRDVFNEKEGKVVDDVNVMIVFDTSASAEESSNDAYDSP